MKNAPVIVVHLRQPKQSDQTEKRSDPFYEFGSFGCTKCHIKNLMNPKKGDDLLGKRFAFAQGGRSGFRLVLLTPPVKIVSHSGKVIEATWEPAEMPFRYEHAPILAGRSGESDFPQLLAEIQETDRGTLPAKFSSAFRSRRKPLSEAVAAELIRTYTNKRRKAGPSAIATCYSQSMHRTPPVVDNDRKATLDQKRAEAAGQPAKSRRRC